MEHGAVDSRPPEYAFIPAHEQDLDSGRYVDPRDGQEVVDLLNRPTADEGGALEEEEEEEEDAAGAGQDIGTSPAFFSPADPGFARFQEDLADYAEKKEQMQRTKEVVEKLRGMGYGQGRPLGEEVDDEGGRIWGDDRHGDLSEMLYGHDGTLGRGRMRWT
jgi:hypothetical protein